MFHSGYLTITGTNAVAEAVLVNYKFKTWFMNTLSQKEVGL